ncbi:unnamed protein product [Symbiodinium natans]|uniref:Calmodulin n=1 Tax=Symbiodinium natans TaxID=878477 RepID=A0A812I777_9DINO|nr:unnamed protein product [Symbiodinium natans]
MTVDEVLDENLTLQEEQGELAEAFVAYDKDSSGCLNLSELMHGLVDGRKIDGATHSHPVAMHSAGVNESVAQNFLALHDQDLSGCLNLSEFLGADVLKWSQPSALLQTTISGGCLDGHTETVKQIGGCLKKVNVKNIFPSFWKTVTKLVDCFVDIVVERAKDFAGCLKDVFYGAKEGNACAIYGADLRDVYFDPLDMHRVGRTVESSSTACQDRCNSVAGCAHWSYWPNGGCHLQDSLATPTTRNNQGVVAGPPTCSKIQTVIPDPFFNGKKCGVPGSPNRVFTLRNGEATEEKCSRRCETERDCWYMSAIFGSFCIGCKKPLDSVHTGTLAYKACSKLGGIYHPFEFSALPMSYEASAEACQARCTQTFRCYFFSYVPDKRCYLHPDVATFEARDDKPIVYGPKTCQVAPATPAMEPLPDLDGWMMGKHLEIFNLFRSKGEFTSEENCAITCATHPECIFVNMPIDSSGNPSRCQGMKRELSLNGEFSGDHGPGYSLRGRC